MESTRQSKIARLIQKELSEIFLLQAKSMSGVLVSVTSVSVSLLEAFGQLIYIQFVLFNL